MTRPTAAVATLTRSVLAGTVGSSDSQRFAGVSIVPTQPEPQPASFYPEDRYLVTVHVGEVGWLFDRIANAFADDDGYGMWKEELFGRLGNAGNWYLAQNPASDSQELCLAILCEALDCAGEVESTGGLAALMVTTNNIISDDARWPLDGSRPSTPEEVRAHLHDRLGAS